MTRNNQKSEGSESVSFAIYKCVQNKRQSLFMFNDFYKTLLSNLVYMK